MTSYPPNMQIDSSRVPNAAFDSTPLPIKIPALSIDAPIVGVPYKDNTWDISWLWDQAGWLQGTAYPTFFGNSIITGHLVTADGKPGTFYKKNLEPGMYILVDNDSFQYIYRVASKRFVGPSDESILDHQEKPWLTLITCDSYDARTRTYLRRLVVEAELVNVLPVQ